ncbi:MAG: response regulator [Thermodesulfobacteriota bacterium]
MLESVRVLLVDDDKVVTRVFQEALSIQGYENVTCAGNGEEALQAYPEFLPDLVFMDIDMPVMDGYEATRRIKALDPDARIVVVTGNPSDIRARRSLDEGLARTVLQKPVRLWDLKAIVDAHAFEGSAPESFSSAALPSREHPAFGPLP